MGGCRPSGQASIRACQSPEEGEQVTRNGNARADWGLTEDQLLDLLEAERFKAVLKPEGEPSPWQEAFNHPYKVKCECPMPHIQRSGSQMLGLVVDIDLCCLAREVERLTGKKFYRIVQTEPEFAWDCAAPTDYQCTVCGDWSHENDATGPHMQRHMAETHEQVIRRWMRTQKPPLYRIEDALKPFILAHSHAKPLGPPPPWMRERAKEMKISVSNLKNPE